MERLHILDGHGYIFRAFYGLAGPGGRGVRLTSSKGLPTGALYVFARMLLRLYEEVKPERMAVVFDAPGPTFRDQLDPQYKATRAATPEDLIAQMPHFQPLTRAFAWPVLSIPGVEADDVIATLVTSARARGWQAVIYSGDKDLMQLVDDQVTVVDSMRQITYDGARVTDKFGVGPAQVGDWLALVGDSSDNIPGVAGVGKVTAAGSSARRAGSRLESRAWNSSSSKSSTSLSLSQGLGTSSSISTPTSTSVLSATSWRDRARRSSCAGAPR
jgi:DNA polymerase-1